MPAWDQILPFWPARAAVVNRRLQLLGITAAWRAELVQRGVALPEIPIALDYFLGRILLIPEERIASVLAAIQRISDGTVPQWQTAYGTMRRDQLEPRLLCLMPWSATERDTILLQEVQVSDPAALLATSWGKMGRDAVPPAGRGPLDVLVKDLALASNAKFGFLCERVESTPPRARTRALWDGQGFAEPFEFSLADTPCEQVYCQGETVIPAGATRLYPHDPWLVAHRISAYVAVTLRTPSGRAIGHLGVMHDRAMDNAEEVLPALRLAADRAVIELLREQAQGSWSDDWQHWSAMLDALDFAVWVGPPDMSCWFYANRAAAELFGIPRTVLCQSPRRVLAGIHPEDIDRVEGFWISPRHLPQSVEFRYRHPGHVERWIQWRRFTMPLGPDVTYILGLARDITAEKLLSSAAFESLAKLRSLMRAAPDGIVIINEKGQIEEVNPATEKMFGYPADELIGQSAGILAAPPHREHHDEYVQSYVRTGRAKIIGIGRDVVGQRSDGSHFPLRIAVGEAVLSNRRVFIGILQDISQVKQREQELVDARRAAESANEAKSRFLATVSHELRTPLNGLLGMNMLLVNTPLTADQRRFVDNSITCSKILLELVNNLLDLSKIEAGKVHLEISPARLDSVIEEVYRMFLPSAEEKGIALRHEVDERAKRKVMCDANRFRQILVNLVGNALKFTHHGHVRVALTAQSTDERCLGVRLAVEDTGIGISSDQIDRIFQPFEQADLSVTRRYGGSGLGLTICKQFVEMMGGRIGVESTKGVGSTFWVELAFPLAEEEQSDASGLVSDSQAPEHGVPLRPLRILLAEDNPVNQLYMSELLRMLGCHVTLANDGRQAVDWVSREPFDLVLMDVQMPEMDGLAAASEIRRQEELHPSLPRVPIVALTAHTTSDDIERCRLAGMDDYLSKPVGSDDIRRVLLQYARTSDT